MLTGLSVDGQEPLRELVEDVSVVPVNHEWKRRTRRTLPIQQGVGEERVHGPRYHRLY